MGGFRGFLYLLGPPLLLAVAIPLAFFAFITTVIAVTALTVRVSIVYFELGLALVQAYLFPPTLQSASKLSSPGAVSPRRARNRRSSVASTVSSHDGVIPTYPRLSSKSASFVSLIGPGELTRDYEGVGGWRVTNNEDEEAIWVSMNSRLELPAMVPKRNHHRSWTGGSQSPRWSWSPVQSRARTPNHLDEKHAGGGYFPLQPSASTTRLLGMHEKRRKNSGGSNTTSTGSSSRRTSLTITHTAV